MKSLTEKVKKHPKITATIVFMIIVAVVSFVLGYNQDKKDRSVENFDQLSRDSKYLPNVDVPNTNYPISVFLLCPMAGHL